jgi:hypothetical protein
MFRFLLPILLTTLALAGAPTAGAQDTPFGPVPTPEPTIEPVPGSDEVGRGTLYLIGAAVLLGVVGIGYAISRDARRSLTADDRSALEREETADRTNRTPSSTASGEVSREARARARKQRSKAKAARAARKRNR